jgi:hypothetical protein
VIPWRLVQNLNVMLNFFQLCSMLILFFFSNFATSSLNHFNYTRQAEQENISAHANENDPNTIPNDDDDIFLGLDDVPGNWMFV